MPSPITCDELGPLLGQPRFMAIHRLRDAHAGRDTHTQTTLRTVEPHVLATLTFTVTQPHTLRTQQAKPCQQALNQALAALPADPGQSWTREQRNEVAESCAERIRQYLNGHVHQIPSLLLLQHAAERIGMFLDTLFEGVALYRDSQPKRSLWHEGRSF